MDQYVKDVYVYYVIVYVYVMSMLLHTSYIFKFFLKLSLLIVYALHFVRIVAGTLLSHGVSLALIVIITIF